VDGVEGLGLGLGEAQALLGDDRQARLLQLGVDPAGEVAAGGVGLDDRKRAFAGHGRASSVSDAMDEVAPCRRSRPPRPPLDVRVFHVKHNRNKRFGTRGGTPEEQNQSGVNR
jgi:hypothetical protein